MCSSILPAIFCVKCNFKTIITTIKEFSAVINMLFYNFTISIKNLNNQVIILTLLVRHGNVFVVDLLENNMVLHAHTLDDLLCLYKQSPPFYLLIHQDLLLL